MWQRFKVWRVKLSERFEAYKYRNVDLNDPEVRKNIRDTKEYMERQRLQMWFALKLGGLMVIPCYIILVFEDAVWVKRLGEIWSWIIKHF